MPDKRDDSQSNNVDPSKNTEQDQRTNGKSKDIDERRQMDNGDLEKIRFQITEDDRMDLIAHKVQRRMLQWAGGWVTLLVVIIAFLAAVGGRGLLDNLLSLQVDKKVEEVETVLVKLKSSIDESSEKAKDIYFDVRKLKKAKQFEYYRETFANARSAGEQVILNYGTALKEDQRDRELRVHVDEKKVSLRTLYLAS
jgi:hypothetical protein